VRAGSHASSRPAEREKASGANGKAHDDRCCSGQDNLPHRGGYGISTRVGESFLRTEKYEEVYVRHYQTFEETQARLQTFLEDVYNAKGLHSPLGYAPPNEFEANYLMC
jgi:hypothetical protein